MKMTLTIKKKLMGLGFISVLMVAIVAVSGYWGENALRDASDEVLKTSLGMRNHMAADMMHDALKSDVLASILAGERTGNEAERKEVVDSLHEHSASFRTGLAANEVLGLDVDILLALQKAKPALEAYIKSAETILPLALSNRSAADAMLPKFMQDFEVLEGDMAVLSDLIGASAAKSQEQGAVLANRMRMINVVLSCIAFVVLLTFSFLTGRSITLPLNQAVNVARKVAAGDLTGQIDVGAQDEIGALMTALKEMNDRLRSLVGQIAGSTAQLATAAEEMSAVTEQTSQGVKQQQTETDQIATAMNEMSATVQDVARNASAAAQAAHQADEQANNGKQVVAQTMEAIDALAGEVEKAGQVIQKLEGDSISIGAVLDVIKGIAEQTNLLALNAAIEAARAGEQGRGFAVVADEVRTLAQRTQQSTQEIRKMIESLQSGAKNAVQVMLGGKKQAQMSVEQAAKAGAALETITRAVATITDMNTQIASAAEEQSAVAEEMNRNIVNISQVANQTAQGAHQTATGSSEVASLAGRLQAAVGQFKV